MFIMCSWQKREDMIAISVGTFLKIDEPVNILLNLSHVLLTQAPESQTSLIIQQIYGSSPHEMLCVDTMMTSSALGQ